MSQIFLTKRIYTKTWIHVIWLTCFMFVIPIIEGRISVDVSPKQFKFNDDGEENTVTLKCTLFHEKNNQELDHRLMEKLESCSLFWTEKYHPDGDSKHEVLRHSNTVSLKSEYMPDTKVLYSVSLTIPSYYNADLPYFVCHHICGSERENVTVDLKALVLSLQLEYQSDRDVVRNRTMNATQTYWAEYHYVFFTAGLHSDIGYSATLLSSITCLLIIVTLVITIIGVSCHQHRHSLDQTPTQSRSSSEDLFQVTSHGGDCRCRQCILYDPPPRYSIVSALLSTSELPTSELTNVRSMEGDARNFTLHGKALAHASLGDTEQRKQKQFVKPPDYDEALEFLTKNGVPFNPQTLSPMPPAYTPPDSQLVDIHTQPIVHVLGSDLHSQESVGSIHSTE